MARNTLTHLPLFFILLSTLLFMPRSYFQAKTTPFDIYNIHRLASIVISNVLMLFPFIRWRTIRRTTPLPLRLLFFYIFLGIISSLVLSKWLEYSGWKLLELFTVAFYGFYLWNFRDPKVVKEAYKINIYFYKILLICVALNLLFFKTQAIWHIKGIAAIPFRFRSVVPFIDSTQIGLFAAIIFFITTLDIIAKRGIILVRVFWWSLSLFFLVMAQGRAAWFGTILAFTTYYFYYIKYNKLIKFILFLPIFFMVYDFLPYIISFLTRGQSLDIFLRLSNRTMVWTFAFETYNNLPLLGKICGGGFASINREVGLLVSQSGFISTVDNEFINALLSCGLGGLFSIFAIYFLLLRTTLFRQSEFSPETTGIIILLFVRAFFNTHIALYSIFSPLFPILIVLLYSEINRVRHD